MRAYVFYKDSKKYYKIIVWVKNTGIFNIVNTDLKS